MPTDAQIRAESYWQREVVTTELDWLADELCRRTGQPRVAAGTKGNEAHRSGGHRSQEWILNSNYATSRTYTVQSGLTALQARHVAAVDFTPGEWGTARNRVLMREQTGRLLAAMKAGQLDGVRELFGTLDGRTVTGWHNPDNRVITSDDSHLDHWHLTLDRRRCADRALMERIVAVTLGEDTNMPEIDFIDGRVEGLTFGRDKVRTGYPNAGEVVWPVQKLNAIDLKVTALATALAGVDEATAAGLKPRFDALDAALAAAAVRDAQFLDLLQKHADGTLTAEAVVARMGELLSAEA